MKKSLLINILLENDLLIDALRWNISPPRKAIYEGKEYAISLVKEETPEDSGPYILIFEVEDSGTKTFWKVEGYEDSYDETRLYFKTLHQVRPVEKTHLVYEPVEKND